MTYRNTLQGRFVATGYPAATMLFVSFLMWVAGYMLSAGDSNALLSSLGLNFINGLFGRALSLLCYVCVALLLNQLYLFERRISFLPHIFLFLLSVHIFLQPDYSVAAALLFFVLSLAQLLSCNQDRGQERGLFGAVAIFSFSSLFLLQFIYLLPLFFIYLFVAKICNVKNFFAALLGVVTPYWLLFGALFVFPSLDWALLPLRVGVLNIMTPASLVFLPSVCTTLAVEIVVWLVAVCVFFSSHIPAKPLLRRRLLFLFIVNAYLLLLSFILPQDYALLLAWRLPGVAVMAAYIFSMKITRASNIFFIILNIMWLVIAALCLWTI